MKTSAPKSKTTGIRLGVLQERLDAYAAAQGVTSSVVIRKAIEAYLDRAQGTSNEELAAQIRAILARLDALEAERGEIKTIPLVQTIRAEPGEALRPPRRGKA